MVQDQLVDYISSQTKLGVSREAIKGALVSAGWVAADVDDTLQKVGGGVAAESQSMKPAEPMATSTTKPASAYGMGSMGSGTAGSGMAKSAGPQVIRVSDLVSASPMAGSAGTTTATATSMNLSKTSAAQFGGKISGNTFEASPMGVSRAMSGSAGIASGGGMAGGGSVSAGGSKKMLVAWVVAVVLVLVLGGLAGYFYSANAGLSAKVSSLTASSASVTAQLNALQAQVNGTSTGMAAQIASLTAANADLALDLSFYVAPAVVGSTSAPVASSPISVAGTLWGGGKVPYTLTTQHSAQIFIANSTDAKIGPLLKPLVGASVWLTGTYIPGSDQMTVASVATSSTQ